MTSKRSALAQYMENPHESPPSPQIEEFDTQDTIKARKPFGRAQNSGTLKGPLAAFQNDQGFDINDGFDLNDDFDLNSEPLRLQPHQLPELALSESESPSRRSMSSLSTLSSLAEEGESDNFDVDLNAGPEMDLEQRFLDRQRRQNQSQTQRSSTLTPAMKRALELEFRDESSQVSDEDVGSLAAQFDRVDLKKSTINKNVIFGRLSSPRRTLRASQSTMQLPSVPKGFDHQRTLKSGVSMLSLSQRRPLTFYKEKDVQPRKQRSQFFPQQGCGLGDRRKRNIGLIRNPQPAPVRHEVRGMVFDPAKNQWEGNDADGTRFETVTARKDMLLRLGSQQLPPHAGSMVFDAVNLQWVPAAGHEAPDPFADLEELAFSRSTRSTASESHRPELSASDTFTLPRSTQRLWTELDLRFMRKFGQWIVDGDTHAAYDIYKMIH